MGRCIKVEVKMAIIFTCFTVQNTEVVPNTVIELEAEEKNDWSC